MEPGLQHTVCELLLLHSRSFNTVALSRYLIKFAVLSFWGRLFCETAVFVTLFDILVCTLCFQGGYLTTYDEVFLTFVPNGLDMAGILAQPAPIEFHIRSD